MKKKDEILEASFRLFLEKGFDNVSLNEIKKESNITTGGLYYHFESKYALLTEVFNKYIFNSFETSLESIKISKGTPEEKLLSIIRAFIGYGSESEINKLDESDEEIDYRKLHLLYLSGLQNYDIIAERYQDFNLKLIDFVQELVEESKSRDEIKEDLDSHDVAVFIQSVIVGTLTLWVAVPDLDLKENMHYNVNQIFNAVKK